MGSFRARGKDCGPGLVLRGGVIISILLPLHSMNASEAQAAHAAVFARLTPMSVCGFAGEAASRVHQQ